MFIVTTMSYDQLGTLIRDKEVSLDNDSLIFGQTFDAVRNYVQERMGSPGYVFGVRGKLNKTSIELLTKMDKAVRSHKLLLQADVKEEDAIRFSVQGLAEAAKILAYGLPDEMVNDQMDSAIISEDSEPAIEIVCVPSINNTGNIKITALDRNIEIATEGITFVKLSGG